MSKYIPISKDIKTIIIKYTLPTKLIIKEICLNELIIKTRIVKIYLDGKFNLKGKYKYKYFYWTDESLWTIE